MAFRSSSSNTGTSGTNANVAVPTGVAANDIIILLYSNDGTAAATPPTGFTALDTSPTNFGPDGQTGSIAWKRTTGADTGTYTYGGGASSWCVYAFAFSGRDTANPPVISTQKLQTTGSSSPVSAALNGLTALAADDLLWTCVPDTTSSSATAVTGFTQPSGYTASTVTQLAFAQLLAARLENVSAGATGTVTGSFTLNTGTAGFVGWLIRIPPVPVAQNITPTAGVKTAATATVTAPALLGGVLLVSQSTDNFNRANSNVDGSLGWVRTVDASLPIVSNQVVGVSATNCGVWRSGGGDTYANDQYSQAVVGTTALLGPSPNGSWVGLSVRNQDDRNCYVMIYYKPFGAQYELDIYKRVAGAFTLLGSVAIGSSPLAAGAVLRLEVQGSALRGLINGTVTTTASDSTFASGGSPGVMTFDIGSLDNWNGGNVTMAVAAGASTQATATVTTPVVGLAIDSQEPSGVGTRGTNPTTWTFNNVAGNLLVVGAVATDASTTSISGATYNGVSMTAGPTIAWESNRSVVQLFYLANPATGSHTVSVSGGTGHILAGAISFSGADTTTPFGTTSSAKQDTTPDTHAQAGSITAASGNYVFGVGGYGAGGPETSDHAATFALVGSGSTSGDNIGSDIASSSGSAINAGFTFGSADFWGIVAAEIRAAPTGISLTPTAQSATVAVVALTAPTGLAPTAQATTQAIAAIKAPTALTPTAQAATAATATVTTPGGAALTVSAQTATVATALVTAPAALAATASSKTAASAVTTAPAVLAPTAQTATQATVTLTVGSVPTLAPAAGVQTQATASVAAAARISPQAAVQTQATLSVNAGAVRAPVLTYPTTLVFAMPVTSLSLVVP